jgi:hypothetical protein
MQGDDRSLRKCMDRHLKGDGPSALTRKSQSLAPGPPQRQQLLSHKYHMRGLHNHESNAGHSTFLRVVRKIVSELEAEPGADCVKIDLTFVDRVKGGALEISLAKIGVAIFEAQCHAI